MGRLSGEPLCDSVSDTGWNRGPADTSNVHMPSISLTGSSQRAQGRATVLGRACEKKYDTELEGESLTVFRLVVDCPSSWTASIPMLRHLHAVSPQHQRIHDSTLAIDDSPPPHACHIANTRTSHWYKTYWCVIDSMLDLAELVNLPPSRLTACRCTLLVVA